ncbi:hypothetical protein MSG28_014265 [Choristoneura fumiferana]|uniref:Uncharacterized protein n=1 Tax=Choristoneura fumiferana TaxID=7141 RepID=A0ACC0JGG4_CHOFU|nr:hypothetical protein MSG28_014265 [Choristoneura fumiferana]
MDLLHGTENRRPSRSEWRFSEKSLVVITYIFLLILQNNCQTVFSNETSQIENITKRLDSLDNNVESKQCHSCHNSSKFDKKHNEVPNYEAESFIDEVISTVDTFTTKYLLVNKTEKQLENEVERVLDEALSKDRYEIIDGVEIKPVNDRNARTLRHNDDAESRALFTFGLKKFFVPLLFGAQLVKGMLLAMFLPSILGSFGKILGKVDDQTQYSNDQKDFMAYETDPAGAYAYPQDGMYVFQKIPASSMILSNYDPFYSPLLSRLAPTENGEAGTQIGGQSLSDVKLESCREQLICLMYASPAKYAPYSNLILRFFRYMRAARRGQEGADCARAHPGCAAAAPAHTMIAAYHDINKLPEAQGRGFLDWLGFGEDQDPYIQQATQQCVNGDLGDCFKAQALRSFDDFFDKPAYQEPPQLSSQPRSEDSDWDALVKFGMRKIERFLRSTALEMALDDEVTSGGVIAPRFLDEIADEVDVIEDKKAPPFRRHKLKKLIIPMLLILKLFKLKLLLFLPLILGLASFKKFLGFMALVIPGVIGYFKFCKPNSSPFSSSHYNTPQYSPAGIGLGGPYRESHYEQYEYPTGHKYGSGGYGNGGVSFRDHESNAQNLAYNGWEYRNKKGTEDIKAGDA